MDSEKGSDRQKKCLILMQASHATSSGSLYKLVASVDFDAGIMQKVVKMPSLHAKWSDSLEKEFFDFDARIMDFDSGIVFEKERIDKKIA